MLITAFFTALLLWQTTPIGNSKKPVESTSSNAVFYLLKDLPGFNWGRRDPYRVDPFIRAAANIQAMGKQTGSYFLLALTQSPKNSEATFVLARMLFVPKEGKDFRCPGIGAPSFIWGSIAQWPLEPITLVDGIPFLVTTSYRLSGFPEMPEKYVKYCIENCDWNAYAFQPKSKQEKERALEKLLAVGKRKQPSDLYYKDFLADQIK